MRTKIILLFLAITLVFSCNDSEFLDEMPITAIGLGDFYKTPEHFELAVNAIYKDLRLLAGTNSGMMYYGSYWALTELRSDNTTFQHNQSDNSAHPWHNIDKFEMAASNGIITYLWNHAYASIGRCNYLISSSEKLEDADSPLINRCVAEAKFFRALHYFQLVRTFGDIPLLTEPTTNYNQAFENDVRIDKSKIYELINSDLNAAKSVLPNRYSSSDLGRATSGAARTLLAKAYMWQNNYKDAISELESIIASNVYSVLPQYSSVFNINNENNEEIIFDVQYVEGNFGNESVFMYRFLPCESGTSLLPLGQVARTGLNIPTTDLMRSFEQGDDRKNLIDTTYIDNSWGTYKGNIVPYTLKFMDPNHSVKGKTGNNFPVFRYPHVLLMLAECYVREGGGNPLPLINQVRNRAKLPNLTKVTLDDIMHERRIEFHCECDRWDVLQRFGKVQEVMKPHGQEEISLRPDIILPSAYSKIQVLFPIPDAVLLLNPEMTQNEEYK